MLTELYDGRTAVSSPAVSPRRTPHRLRRVDDRPRRRTRHGRACGWPAPAIPPRSPPARTTVSRSGRPTAASSRSRRGAARRKGDRRCTCCRSPGRARCARWRRCPRASPTCEWSPDGKRIGVQQPHPRRALRRQGRELAAAAQDRDASSRSSTARAASSTGRSTSTSCPPTARARRATSRPAPFQHDGVSWLPDSSGVVTSAPRHDTWDFDLAIDLYLVPLDGEIRALTTQTGTYAQPGGVARRPPRRVHRRRRSGDLPAELRRRRDRRRRRRRSRGRRRGLDRTFCATAGVACAGLDRRRDHPRHRRGPRRDAPLPRRRRRPRAPVPLTQGRDLRADVRRRRRRRSPWSQSTVEHPGRARDARRLDAAGHHHADASLARAGSVRRAVRRRLRRDRRLDHATRRASTRRRRYPVLLNVHGGPFTQYGEIVLRRGADAGGGRVRRGDVATRAVVERAAHGVGSGDHRPEAPDGARHRVGQRRRRRRAGRARPRAGDVPVLRPRSRRHARRELRRLHGDDARRPATATASGRSAANGPCNNMLTEEFSSDISTVLRVDASVSTAVEDPDEYAADVADPVRPRTSRCRC